MIDTMKVSPMDIWISNDASTFQKARLPAQVRHVQMYGIYEDSIGRIIIPISTIFTDEKTNNQLPQKILISDSQGLKFLPVEWTINPHFGYIDIASPHFLEGTIIGSFHPSFDYSP
nr:ASN_HP1_G0046620.mRNA.1.CDS.1 [Saccharomyces cerevisiae]